MSWLLYDKPGYGRRLEWIQLAAAEELFAAGLVVKRWGWYVQDFTREDLPPFIILDAEISGTPQVGYTLTCISQFGGADPIDLEFVWTKTPGGVIAGATEGSYNPVAADVGATITCTVTATNANGVAESTSPAVGPIAAAAAPQAEPVPPEFYKPANVVVPSINGSMQVGQDISVMAGTWNANPAAEYSYQWKRDSQPIVGANGPMYTLVADDVGAMITCTVVAFNSEGSSQRTTAGEGPVLA